MKNLWNFGRKKEESDTDMAQQSQEIPNTMESTNEAKIMDKINPAELKALAVEQIKMVYDPEIPVNIYELGLIYEVSIQEENKVHVLMTLTAPACPAAEIIPEEIKEKVNGISYVSETEIELTFEPPWNPEMMSEEAKLELGFL